MPQSINGLGTHYCGRRNLEFHVDQCEFCERVGKLYTYETTHFFIVFFVPIIPLGKIQVIDQCSACMQHRAMPVSQWQEVKREAIEASSAQLAEKMDDPESALEHLQTLTAFKQMEEAADFAEAVENSHSAEVDVQFFLGAWYEAYGKKQDADRCFENAYRIDPNHLGAMRAKALTLVEKGQLDEAQQMLTRFEPPSTDYDPALFFQLGKGYQRANRHQQALEIFGSIASTNPELARSKWLRKAVKESEAASGTKSRVVKQASIFHSYRFWALLATVVILVALYFGIANITNNRAVHVINGLSSESLTIRIDGGKELEVQPEKFSLCRLAEGKHHVEILEPAKFAATREFEFSTPFWTRMFQSPVFVLDPLESGVVIWEQQTYAVNPISDGQVKLVFRQLFTEYPDVDYAFVPFPATIELDNEKSRIRKTRVHFQPFTPGMFHVVESGLAPEAELEMTEDWVLRNTRDPDSLDAYCKLCAVYGQGDRCERFLKSLLDERPINLFVHRLYQDEVKANGVNVAELPERYDGYLKSDPKDPDLIYLRGCVEPKVADRGLFFERALESDPKHVRSIRALGINQVLLGDFEKAAEYLGRAVQLDANDQVAQESFVQMLFATKRFDEIKRFIRPGGELSDFQLEANYLYATQRKKQLQPLSERFGRLNGDSNAMRQLGEIHVAYLLNRITKVKSLAWELQIPIFKTHYQFVAAVEELKLENAVRFANKMPDAFSGARYVAIVALMNDDLVEANDQIDQWLQTFAVGDGLKAMVQTARNGEFDLESFRKLELDPIEKRVAGAMLKLLANVKDPELDEYLRYLNYDPSFPHHLIEQVARH